MSEKISLDSSDKHYFSYHLGLRPLLLLEGGDSR